MSNKTIKKQSHSDRYQGYKDISPNNECQVWVKDKNPTHSTREAARPYMDCDYWNQLSKEERKWLLQFNSEYYLTEKPKKSKPLHHKDMYVEIYDSNNKRRRNYCLADGRPIHNGPPFSTKSPEDALIEALDLLNKKS